MREVPCPGRTGPLTTLTRRDMLRNTVAAGVFLGLPDALLTAPVAAASAPLAGAIVFLDPGHNGANDASIDRPVPGESWRWGGPDWIGGAGEGAPGRLASVTLRVPDPAATAARWGEVLGLAPDGALLHLDGEQDVRFEPGAEGLAEIVVELPAGPAEPLAFGAARVLRA